MKVLLLGADGFTGRHIAFHLRDQGVDVLATRQPLPPKARQLYRIWFALGWPAFAALVAVFWLMVTKPGLWQG